MLEQGPADKQLQGVQLGSSARLSNRTWVLQDFSSLAWPALGVVNSGKTLSDSWGHPKVPSIPPMAAMQCPVVTHRWVDKGLGHPPTLKHGVPSPQLWGQSLA